MGLCEKTFRYTIAILLWVCFFLLFFIVDFNTDYGFLSMADVGKTELASYIDTLVHVNINNTESYINAITHARVFERVMYKFMVGFHGICVIMFVTIQSFNMQ